MKVLLIEDDLQTCQLLREACLQADIDLSITHTAASGLSILKEQSFEIIVLDWNLPDSSGLDLCRQYRNNGGNTPVIFVTGRHSIKEKELAFEFGADDYLSKPFEFAELLARMKNLKRRSPLLKKESFTIDNVTVNTATRQILTNNKIADLSQIETNIILYLIKKANTCVSAEELSMQCLDSSSKNSTTAIRVHINSIRNKTEFIGLPNFLRTVRGRGYLILNSNK